MTWLEDMVVVLKTVERNADGTIPTEAYLGAIDKFPPIYEALFSVQMVVGILKKDITNGAAEVRKAAASMGEHGATLNSMCSHVVQTMTVEGARKSKDNGAKALLWLNRASTFMTRLMRGLADGLAPKEAAAKAYGDILKPYHGFMTSKVVGTAMGLVPNIETILKKLDLPTEEEGKRQMDAFLALMEPLTQEVMAIIDSHGINFPDKV